MNLSRRSLLRGIFAAPAVIAADRLMPIKLWLPTIYGAAVHDDWEGLQALIDDKPVRILAKIWPAYEKAPELGMTSMNNHYLLSKPLVFTGNGWRRDNFIGDTFERTDPRPRQPTILKNKWLHTFFLNNTFL